MSIWIQDAQTASLDSVILCVCVYFSILTNSLAQPLQLLLLLVEGALLQLGLQNLLLLHLQLILLLQLTVPGGRKSRKHIG